MVKNPPALHNTVYWKKARREMRMERWIVI